MHTTCVYFGHPVAVPRSDLFCLQFGEIVLHLASTSVHVGLKRASRSILSPGTYDFTCYNCMVMD